VTSLNDIAVTPEDAKLITQFHTELMADKMELCGRCQQRWFNMELQKDDNGVEVCQACRRRDMPSKRNQPGQPPLPYFYSAANKLDFGEVPPQLAACHRYVFYFHLHRTPIRRSWVISMLVALAPRASGYFSCLINGSFGTNLGSLH